MEGTKMDNVFLTFAFGIFILGSCSARVVTVSPGPLIRVEDQPVSIRCEVNEYSGPREQDFEWMMTRDSSGVRIKIISTFDTSYSHPSLSKRVASGDISVVRLEDNEVELKIGEVKSQDAGLYWCQTPSTDSVISGNYEAQVQLIVIPNTLSVSPKILPQEVPEGSDITLSCNVTRVLTHPTYLSVTWAFKSGTTSEEVLTFGPQGDVRTGAKYASRYSEGGIRLVPGRNGLFTLVISRVTTSDSGTYECIGKEWTHENKGTWIKIVENKKEMGAVTVIPTVDSLTVKATSSLSSSSKALLSPGDTLALLCSVTANNLQTLALEVTWLANDRNIITIDQSGVVNSNFSSSSEVVEQGKVSLEKTGAGDFRLSVRDVGDGNGGEYSCHVRAFIDTRGKSAGGSDSLNMVAQKKSSPVVVQVSRIMPNYTLTLEPTLIPKTTAEPTELACRVKNITHLPPGDRLGVMWERTALQGSDPKTLQHIGSLDGNGNLQPGLMYSELLKSGMLSLTRIQPDTFMLRILQTQEVDMGHYSCTVSVWSFGSQEDMLKTTEQKSSPVLVRWDIKRSSLNVIAKRVREASVGGATFEMTCSVTTENLGEAGYSVLIQTQESLESSVKTIMTLSPDNVVQHGGATSPNRRDSLVLTKSSPSEFRFRLEGVQLSDRGFYWCDITAWAKQQQGQAWTKATSAESNKVRIDFQETGPSFSIAIHSDDTNVYPSTTTKIKCSLDVSSSSSKTGDLAYEVLWFFTRLRGGQTTAQLASVDRFGIVKTEMRNSSSEISVERIDAHTYLLNIFGTQDGDSGEYFCTATPWYLSASTGAWTQAEVLTSSRVFLTVQFAVWNSLKLPLLYGAAASLGVGLFSLILGLVCAQCCCRNIAHTPRSRNKLMDLEMD